MEAPWVARRRYPRAIAGSESPRPPQTPGDHRNCTDFTSSRTQSLSDSNTERFLHQQVHAVSLVGGADAIPCPTYSSTVSPRYSKHTRQMQQEDLIAELDLLAGSQSPLTRQTSFQTDSASLNALATVESAYARSPQSLGIMWHLAPENDGPTILILRHAVV